MKISELIKELDEFRAEYGDLPVCFYDEVALIHVDKVEYDHDRDGFVAVLTDE